MASLLKFAASFRYSISSQQKIKNLNLPASAIEIFSGKVCKRYLNANVRHFNKKDKPLTDSFVMVQDGTYILEMPCIVQIINGDFEISSNGKTKCGDSYEGMGLEYNHTPKPMFKELDFEEECEMTLGFMNCNSVKEVYNLLSTCPEEEVTPIVALAVMKRIFDLESKNSGSSSKYKQNLEESNFTFTRTALLKRLVETVCSGADPQIIVDALRTMSNDTNLGDKWSYLEQLCTESIILATDGKLSLSQICELVKAFHSLGKLGNNYIEKLWVGMNERQQKFNAEELCCLMSILPILKNSTRSFCYNFVERRLPSVWQELKPEHVIRIAYVLVQLNMPHSRLLGLLSKWTSLNIHTLTEGNLRWIVFSFLSLKYSDENFQNCLGRYMKVKGTNINDKSLVSVILDYCTRLRIRNPTILSLAAEYFVHNGESLTLSKISSIVTSFGYLNYSPPNAYEFFTVLESQINKFFSKFSPDDLLDILLSCTYLQRYPLNFVSRVFNPNFFDRLHSLDHMQLDLGREKLIVLDSALCLEASNYKGPFLPKNYTHRNYWQDARILQCINKLQYPLLSLIGNSERISNSVHLETLPNSSFYTVDVVADLSGKLVPFKQKQFRDKLAFLIHLPEHYDMTETYLTGPQAMKMRHIEKVGYLAVSLNYRTLNKLFNHPKRLENYISHQMTK